MTLCHWYKHYSAEIHIHSSLSTVNILGFPDNCVSMAKEGERDREREKRFHCKLRFKQIKQVERITNGKLTVAFRLKYFLFKIFH